jgi:3-hydroxyacyl-[acyl-carrier-protein] dehydratase
LPHREPFLFVTEVVELVPGERATAVSGDPGAHLRALGYREPRVPLWYLTELMAQTGALAALAGRTGEKTLLTGIDGMRVLAPARVDRPLQAEVELLGEKRGIGRRQGVIRQDGQLVAEGVVWYARRG